MPIRQRLNRRLRKLAYHREFGSLKNPPIRHGNHWPNGSQVVHTGVPKRKGKPIILGWIVKREFAHGYRSIGVYVATAIGYVDKTKLEPRYIGIDLAKDHKYIEEFSDYEDALEALHDAWIEQHGITIR